MEERLAQKARRTGELTKEDMERKQTEADLRRNGLLSARGGKAGDHFIRAAEVAMSATSEKEKRATGERKDLLQKKNPDPSPEPFVTLALALPLTLALTLTLALALPLTLPLPLARTCCRRRSSSSASGSRSAGGLRVRIRVRV